LAVRKINQKRGDDICQFLMDAVYVGDANAVPRSLTEKLKSDASLCYGLDGNNGVEGVTISHVLFSPNLDASNLVIVLSHNNGVGICLSSCPLL
jgi:hypothetical protein